MADFGTTDWNVLLDAAPSQSVWEYTDGTDGWTDTRQMHMGFLTDMASVITDDVADTAQKHTSYKYQITDVFVSAQRTSDEHQ